MRLLKYGLLRLAIFFVVWGACMLLGLGWIFSTVVAAVVALAASYLFFNPLRTGAGQDVAAAWEGRPGRRGATEQKDMDVEDAYTEGRFYEGPPGGGTDSGADTRTDTGADARPATTPEDITDDDGPRGSTSAR